MPSLRHMKIAWFEADFKVQYIHTPAANVLTRFSCWATLHSCKIFHPGLEVLDG